MEKIILILDKIDYQYKEESIRNMFSKNQTLKIYYTEYEDAVIRKVCKWKYIGEFLQHILYWIKSYKYASRIFLENKDGRIVSINPIVGMFLGFLNRKHKFKLVVAGFLFEQKKSKIYYTLRKKVTKKFLSGIDLAIVYAKKEVSYYENLFNVKKFRFVQYGIDYDAHMKYKGALPKKYIFSGGRSNRDFHTLIEAYESLEDHKDVELCIATRPVVLQGERVENVKILKDVVLENFGSAMGSALIVVLPLIETEISAGHMVLLEALERNKIIIISKIDAVLDYVSEDQVIFYESGNVKDLRTKIEYALENLPDLKNRYKENRKYYIDNYTFISFIKRLIDTE